MKRNVKKQNNSKKILFIALIILILLTCIIMLTKSDKNNKINNIKQESLGLSTNIGEATLDITNQITETPNKPVLSAGMIPVKYKNGNWYITTEDDSEWYNYANGNMANIMLSDRIL